MPAAPSPLPANPARSNGAALLPATRFFVRRIPLVVGQDPVAQVELALETIGPFTPGQLYYGYCPSQDGTQALVFAAYRRNFSAADTADWTKAHSVLPDFAVWLGEGAKASKGLWLHEHPDFLTILAWDGASELPAGVLARETTAESRDKVRADLIAEARRRFDAGSAEPRILSGTTVAGALGKEGLPLTAGERSTLLAPPQLRAIDVRDKVELAGQITRQKRDRWIWLAFAAAVAGLVGCVVVECGLQVSNLVMARQRRAQEAKADEVRKIVQADQLARRMENMAGQSLRPLEMLNVVNNVRPLTLEFSRVVTASTNPRLMEIDAQSSNAADPQDYEGILARTPGIEKVELRDLRTIGGKTTFALSVTFKPGLGNPGGAR